MSLSTNNPVILKPIECILIEPKVRQKFKPTIRAQCAICMEPVKFPLSHGCCTFKCCRSCYNQLSVEQKQKCSGCRTDTGIPRNGGSTQERDAEEMLSELNAERDRDAEEMLSEHSARIRRFSIRISDLQERNDALNTNLEEHVGRLCRQNEVIVDLLEILSDQRDKIDRDAELLSEHSARIDRDAEMLSEHSARIERDSERHERYNARIDSLIIADRDQCARITSLSISLDEKTIECAQLSSMLDANVADIEDMFHDALEVQ